MRNPAANWHKIDNAIFQDSKLKRIARKHGSSAYALWFFLIASAKNVSHCKDNPEGLLKTNLDDLSEAIYSDVSKELLSDFETAEMIEVSGEITAPEFSIRLVNFLKWNHAKGSNSERQANWRERKDSDSMLDATTRNNRVTERNEIVTDSNNRVTERNEVSQVHNIDIDIDLNKNNLNNNYIKNKYVEFGEQTTPCQSDSDVVVDESLKLLSWRGLKGKRVPSKAVREVFDYWLAKTGRSDSRVKPTTQRLAKIKTRLNSQLGYTVEDLKLAVDYYAASEFHNGSKTGKRYDDIVTIFRDDNQIEKALEADTVQPVKSAEELELERIGSMYGRNTVVAHQRDLDPSQDLGGAS